MSKTLNSIRDAINGGARSNKYIVYLTGVDGVKGDLLCKSASFPGRTIGEIEVWNQGRKFIIPGDTSFTNEWSLSFYNTQDHALRKQFIEWMISIDNFEENKKAGNFSTYMVDMKVHQINNDGSEGQGYMFHNVFPKDIGEITVEDESADAIQEFDVSLSFSHWVIIK